MSCLYYTLSKKTAGAGDEIAKRHRLKLSMKCYWHDRRNCEDSRCDFLTSDLEPGKEIMQLMKMYKLDGVDIVIMSLGIKSEWSVKEIQKKICNWKNSRYPDNEIEFLMSD